MEAHFNDVTSVDMFRTQRRKLSAELTVIDRKSANQVAVATATDDIIKQALETSVDNFHTCASVSDEIKRPFNQIFFECNEVLHREEYTNTFTLQPRFAETFALLDDQELDNKLHEVIENAKLLEALILDSASHVGGQFDSHENG